MQCCELCAYTELIVLLIQDAHAISELMRVYGLQKYFKDTQYVI